MLYTADERDKVAPDLNLPPPLPGAPIPTICGTEHRLLVAYYTDLPQLDGGLIKSRRVPVLVRASSFGTIAICNFSHPVSYFSVPVSNETFDAHPFAFRGLSGCGVYRVEDSSWLRRLTAIQYYHSRPYPGAFSSTKHFIFVFHDSILEVAADDVEVLSFEGSMEAAQDEMLQEMRARPV